MVTKLAFLLLFSVMPLWADELVRFRAEFDRATAYAGQPVKCDFVLYTPLRMVEVEVAKFPEFRGFWKENLSLRQGKLVADFGFEPSAQWSRVLIGSYVIKAMVDEPNPKIEPMKIVVRLPGSSEETTALSLIDPPLTIRRLPNLPIEIRPSSFSGGVGKFQLYVEKPNLNFRTNEPTLIQYTLQGEGNFDEVNEVNPRFPEGTEILSRRSYLSGSSVFSIKTFEWVVAFPKTESFTLPSLNFTYFDPELQNYETLLSDPINLNHQAPLADTLQEAQAFQFGELELLWRPYLYWGNSRWFFVLNLLFGAVLLFLNRSTFQTRAKPIDQNVFLLNRLRERRQRAIDLWDDGNLEEFLRVANEVSSQNLRLRLGLAPSVPALTRAQLAVRAEDKLDGNLAKDFQKLVVAYDELAFSPKKRCRIEREELYQSFHNLTGNL